MLYDMSSIICVFVFHTWTKQVPKVAGLNTETPKHYTSKIITTNININIYLN